VASRWLADLLVVVHAAFIVYAVAGGLLALRWPRAAWLHLPAVAWAAAVEFAGWICPLTPLEVALRRAAGEAGYPGGFVEHYLVPLVYPAGLTQSIAVGLGVAVLAVNAAVYGWVLLHPRGAFRHARCRLGRLAAPRAAPGRRDEMAAFMTPYAAQTHALLRIVAGLLFLWHGSSKLFGFPTPTPAEAPAFVIYIAGPIELFGGILVLIGLQTRWAAFLCSGLMAAAYWMAHGTKALFPIQNQGELAALYCFVFLYFAANGAGIWSVDGSRSAS
jgi:putative oxidoreductase